MIEIKIHGFKAYVSGEITDKVNRQLEEVFSYSSIEDLSNIIHFYKDRVMYRGIVPDVVEFLENLDYKVKITQPHKPLPDNEWSGTAILREWQTEAMEVMKSNTHGIIKAAPGSGKTVLMTNFIANTGLPALIIVQAEEPFKQAVDSFKKFTNISEDKIGIISGRVRKLGDVNVAMVKTLANEIRDNPDGDIAKFLKSQVKVVFVDEQHHAGADTYVYCLNHILSAYYAYGVSATPFRVDEKAEYIKALFGEVIVEVGFGDQIDAGHLCPIDVEVYHVPPKDYGYTGPERQLSGRSVSSFQKRKEFQAVYKDYIVEGSTGRNDMISVIASEFIDSGFTVAVIVNRIEHAEILSDMIEGSEVLVSSGPKASNKSKRSEIIDKLYHREVKCVVTTLFDEAVDVKSLDVVIIAAGGKSPIKQEQRIRSTRVFDGELRTGHYKKDRGYVVYFHDNADYLKSHSYETVALLKRLVKEHKENGYREYEMVST